MIGPVTSPSVMPVRKEQTEQQTAARAEFRSEYANLQPGTEVTGLFKLVKAPDEFMAILAQSHASMEWAEAAEAKACWAEVRARQDAQPVELAVYKNGEMVGFVGGGFHAQGAMAMAGLLPDKLGSMSIDDLSQAFQSHGFQVVTAKDGLAMNRAQAIDMMTRS